MAELRQHNAAGYDVHVTPLDAAHHFLVIDGMEAGAAQALKGDGFAPCLVLSSGEGKEQAVLKVEKGSGVDEQELADELAGRLNAQWGDPAVESAVQPVRMAGFTIRKVAGRKSVLVRLLEAGWQLCRKAAQLLQALREKADAERELEAKVRRDQQESEVEEQHRVVALGSEGGAAGAFRVAVDRARDSVDEEELAKDAGKVERLAVLAMLKEGWVEDEVIAAVVAVSDDPAGRQSLLAADVAAMVRAVAAKLATDAGVGGGSAHPRR